MAAIPSVRKAVLRAVASWCGLRANVLLGLPPVNYSRAGNVLGDREKAAERVRMLANVAEVSNARVSCVLRHTRDY